MLVALITLLFAGVSVNAISLGKRGLCPMHYVTGPNNLCFRFAEDKKTFDEARMQCESEGGTLANTQSNEAYEFARQHIDKNPVKANIGFGFFGEVSIFTPWTHGWWVGARKGVDFRWFDGQAVGGHWCKQMPDNWLGHESCLEQMGGQSGWNDLKCEERLRFICQRNVLNPCDKVHCGNGNCVNDNHRAVCKCNYGWQGAHCGEKIDYCAGVNCHNGRCVVSGVTPACVCNEGWTGSRCDQAVVVDPCANHPCQNGGACFSNEGGYFCKCEGNFKGKNCEKSCRFEVTQEGLPSKLDAMVLFDGSMSVGEGNFKKSLEFISRFVDKLDLGPSKARLELIQFSHKIAEALDFVASSHTSKGVLRAQIGRIDYLRGGTATGKAMTEALKVFTEKGRHAKDVAKYLVVLTDGNSSETEHALIRQAVPKLKAMGVELVAVGVGSSVNDDELRLIAGGKAANVFSVDSFEKLDSALISKMVEKLCD